MFSDKSKLLNLSTILKTRITLTTKYFEMSFVDEVEVLFLLYPRTFIYALVILCYIFNYQPIPERGTAALICPGISGEQCISAERPCDILFIEANKFGNRPNFT